MMRRDKRITGSEDIQKVSGKLVIDQFQLYIHDVLEVYCFRLHPAAILDKEAGPASDASCTTETHLATSHHQNEMFVCAYVCSNKLS